MEISWFFRNGLTERTLNIPAIKPKRSPSGPANCFATLSLMERAIAQSMFAPTSLRRSALTCRCGLEVLGIASCGIDGDLEVVDDLPNAQNIFNRRARKLLVGYAEDFIDTSRHGEDKEVWTSSQFLL